jgi:hypothetical protein
MQKSWILVAVGIDDSHRDNPGVNEREHHLTGGNLSHEFGKRIPGFVGISLGRPEVASLELLPVLLVLIDPPIAPPHLDLSCCDAISFCGLFSSGPRANLYISTAKLPIQQLRITDEHL